VPETEAILAEADPAAPLGLRDRALLELLYSTGLRRMEAAALKLYDVDASRRLVFVREGKGRRDRGMVFRTSPFQPERKKKIGRNCFWAPSAIAPLPSSPGD
jgi:site-specific recombinase XerD